MTTTFELERILAAQGWFMLAEADICWLDCPEPASCYRVGGGEHIVLCAPHAAFLQAGAWRGDYSGAPLPPGSRAISWPWLPAWEEDAA